ncbi:hypothetical protein [Streptomyces sp. NPDC055287]
MPTLLNYNPATCAGQHISELFRTLKECLGEDWAGADVVQILNEWFVALGINPEGPAHQVDVRVARLQATSAVHAADAVRELTAQVRSTPDMPDALGLLGNEATAEYGLLEQTACMLLTVAEHVERYADFENLIGTEYHLWHALRAAAEGVQDHRDTLAHHLAVLDALATKEEQLTATTAAPRSTPGRSVHELTAQALTTTQPPSVDESASDAPLPPTTAAEALRADIRASIAALVDEHWVDEQRDYQKQDPADRQGHAFEHLARISAHLGLGHS